MQNKIAIIRIRGNFHVKKEVVYTMNMLRLYKKHSCVILDETKSNIGMINKMKDYVTWGELDNDTFKLLLTKRGKLPGNKALTEEYLKEKLNISYDDFSKEFFDSKKKLKDIPGLKLFFKLQPPTKGFERKGIKKYFSMGGSLGYRKDKINELIKRMA
jgi:large subunit ribosomal protein L30|tara:strand:- start:196 stop:669 length:474 start_codon:yes stop_codon:yes gene_type:complete